MFSRLITRSLALAALAALAPVLLLADEYDDLRNRWVQILNGGAFNTADADLAAAVDAIDLLVVSNGTSRDPTNGTGYWDTLNTAPSRTYLWSDLTGTTNSSRITSAFGRLKTMALAYTLAGSALEGNSTLLADIVSALDWMYANRYNETTATYDNWWDWQIGAPIQLNDCTALLYSQLTPTQRTNYMTAVNQFSPSAVYGSGANRMWKCKVVGLRGILVKDAAKIAQARDAVSSVFNYVTSGDGFYVDGSFIQHTKHPYTAGYGRSLVVDVADFLYLYAGSTWAVTDPDQANVYNWLYMSFEPLIYRGEAMDLVRGRESSRYLVSSHLTGRRIIGAFIRASQFAPTADATAFKRAVKYWLQSDTTYASFTTDLSVYDITLAKAILSDAAIISRGPLNGVFAFPSMDRLSAERSAWGAGLAMHSSRIYNFESINGENLKGWHTGAGMLYVYTADLNQFSENYWPTIAPHRLPGTTIEAGVGAAQSKVSGTSVVGSLESWSGVYGLASMNLSPDARSLRGKKAWFFFDDEIVMLGAGILASGGAAIETIVENRKLNLSGNNTFSANGTNSLASLQTAPGTPSTLTGVNYAYLAGNVGSGDGLGYYFPGGVALKGMREARTGNWSSINTEFPNSTNYTNNFLTLWFDHGVNPSAASYSYALLPTASASATAAYAGGPEYTVLENTTSAQAVKENTLNTVGAVFWDSTSKTVGTGTDAITSSTSSAVMAAVSGDELQVSVADLTQTNTGSITISLGRSAASVLDQDSSITVDQLSPTVQFSVNVNGKKGRTQRIRFSLTGGGGTEYIVDNTSAGFSTVGTWTTSSSLPGYYGTNYVHDGSTAADASKTATWTSPITTTGTYAVYMRWTSYTDRPDAAPVEVNYDGGIANLTVNQQSGGGTWVYIGTWSFTGGSGDYVKITGADAGYTIADAVRWVNIPATFFDDFTDGNDTTPLWTKSSGTWSIAVDGSNVYAQTSTNIEAVATAGDVTWTDGAVSARVKIVSNGTGSTGAGVIFRHQDDNNYYFLQLREPDDQVRLWKKQSGSWTQLASVARTLSTGVFYTVDINLSGSLIEAYLDGETTPVISLTNASFSSGRLGLRAANASARFDDVVFMP